MVFHFQQALRALILLTFSAMIFKLHYTGDITKFINPKYESLSQIASILFLILFFIQITRIWTVKENSINHCNHEDHHCHHRHDHGDSAFNTRKLISYLTIVVPLITAFLLPAKALDASIANKKGGMEILINQKQVSKGNLSNGKRDIVQENLVEEGQEADTASENITPTDTIGYDTVMSQKEFELVIQKLEQSANIVMEDTVYATYYEEINKNFYKFKGRNIELKGFVYKEDGLGKNQLVLSRFLITHCVADAGIIGFLSELPEASSINEDTWMEVKGVIDIATYNGTELPIIKVTNWEKIAEPKDPYLYPISIKVL